MLTMRPLRWRLKVGMAALAQRKMRVLDGELLPEPAGAVDEDVEAAGLADDALERGADLRGVGDVAGQEAGVTTAVLDAAGHRLAGLVDVDDEDARPGLAERLRRALADTAGAAGDDR